MQKALSLHLSILLRTAQACLLAMCLSHCTSLPASKSTSVNWQQHLVSIGELNSWEISAKLAIRAPSKNSSANLQWQQSEQHYQLQLAGPFGQGKVIIHGDPLQATLNQAGQEPLSAIDAEALLFEATGWELPITELSTWVKGIPADNMQVSSASYNAEGLLASLSQSGWQITYTRYNTIDSFQLPGRIIATRGALKLILVIHSWKLHA